MILSDFTGNDCGFSFFIALTSKGLLRNSIAISSHQIDCLGLQAIALPNYKIVTCSTVGPTSKLTMTSFQLAVS